MHSGNIEDYSFTHGLQKNVVNGKWLPLHPHTLGRALTHDEMDYNLLYTQQTLAGFRIFGQNADLTLSDDELSKSLIFWKISLNDIDLESLNFLLSIHILEVITRCREGYIRCAANPSIIIIAN